MEINPQDIQIDTYSTGTAWFPRFDGIQLTHVPTGIVIREHSERGQHKNRWLAFETLKAKLEIDTDLTKQLELF